MKNLSKHFYFMLGLLIWTNSPVFAQDNECAGNFENINQACIKQKLQNYNDQPISLSKGLQGTVYFTGTMNKKFAKFQIKSVYISKTECTVYINAGVFDNNKSKTLAKVLSISQSYGAWSKDQIGLNSLSTQNDLLLENRNGKCVLISLLGKVSKYKKFTAEDRFQGSSILYYSALILISLAVFLVANAIFKDDDKFRTQEKLEDADDSDRGNKKINDFVLKYSRPFFKRYFSPIVQGMKSKKSIRKRYRKRLATAGLTKELSPEDFFAFKLFLIIGFPIVFLGLRAFLEADWPVALTPVVAVIGFFYPDIWIKGKIQNRKDEVIMAMPFIVDMLALSVEAGLDFMAAIVKVIDKAPPSALTEEFEILIKDTRLGASRADGLRQMSWRVDVIQVSSFSATLIAADSVGASIGPILKGLSGEMRQKRSAVAEKKGAKAASKILIPLIFLILPAVMIVIAIPFVMEFF